MKSFLTLTLCVCMLYASGQRCATQEYLEQHNFLRTGAPPVSKSDPAARDTLPNEVIVIPVVVHVLYHTSAQNISDVQIKSQIEALNRDYRRKNADAVNTPQAFRSVAADTRIVFSLAKVDPQGYKTTGIIRKHTKEPLFLADDQMKFSSKGGDDAWDADKYLNIWVCDLFGRMLGYSVLPGSPPDRDGVVIKYTAFGTTGTVSAPYNKGRTATHEIGHWLGLRHLWGDQDCGDDGIADTPPQKGGNSGCPIFPKLSSCSPNGLGDMFMNFMDFTDDACMNMFTLGQKAEMRSLFAKGNPRNSLLQYSLWDDAGAQAAPLPPEEATSNSDIVVYPNPFMTGIYIKGGLNSEMNGSKVTIYNNEGRLLKSLKMNDYSSYISMQELPPGLYIIRIETDGALIVRKLIKGMSNAADK